MAGKKQHFIPQHFQRPFLIPDGNEKIWLYRHDLPDGVPVSLKKSAAKEHFYSKLSSDGSQTLDDLVTEYEENNLTGKVNSIRALPVGSEICAADIAEIVTHLSIRSAHIREFVNEGARSMIEVIDRLIHSPEQIESLPSLHAHRVPSGIYGLVASELTERGLLSLTNVSEAALVRLLYFHFRESLGNIKGEASKQFASFIDRFNDHIQNMGKVAHTEILQTSMAPDARVKDLLKLSWHVEKFEHENAILPDCTSIVFDGEKWIPLILSDSKTIQVVVLPLAPDRLAVGKVHGCDPVDLSNYNEFAANACFHFFLSSQKSDEFKEWQSGLGGQLRSELSTMTQGAMGETLQEFLHGADSKAAETTSSLTADQGSEQSGQDKVISYQISLKDCGDQETAEKIGARINPIIAALAKMFSMSGLDGITFARDYRSGLNEVARGVENVDEIIPFEEGDKIGMGMPITILTEDKIKTRIVMRESVAADLLSEDDDVAIGASAVVLYLLANCILTEIIQQRFPDQVMKPLPDEYEAFLGMKTRNIVETYFSTRISSWVKDHSDYYATDALDVLQRSFEDIPIQRNEYGVDGDHEKLYEKVSFHAVEIMKSLARMLAAMAELNENRDIRQDLKEFLIAHQLFEWALLFEKDFNTFYLNIENWSDYDECLFVNRHLERLLVQFGIITDQTDSGALYVHVDS